MSNQIHINPLSKRQRGIYSEVVEIDNAKQVVPTQNIQPEGQTQLFKYVNNNKPIKARSLQNLGSMQRFGKSQGLEKTREQLNQRLQARNLNRKKQFENANNQVPSVDPRVWEPYDAVPGLVPRNVAIDRRRKEYASYSLEELMEFVGIDFNKKEKQVEWMNLEWFDDTTFDDNENNEWLERQKDNSAENHPLTGLGLYQNSEGSFRFRRLTINGYNEEKDQFQGQWKSNGKPIELNRIFICFDAEDPRKYVLRLANAFQQRIYSDSIIRYNYYIDNMPTLDLPSLDQEQKKRIQHQAKSSKKFEDKQNEIGNLITEIEADYSRTMNKIIFDEYLEDEQAKQSDENYPHHLRLPPKPKEKEVPYLGAMELERRKGVKEKYIVNGEVHYNNAKNSTEIFKDFCFHSLYIKEEVIKALQDIREECNDAVGRKMFECNLKEAMPFEQFRSLQENQVNSLIMYLKSDWIESMVSIIKKQFQEVGKGWFNMKETSPITYEFGKLKRFLTLVRLMMQDTLTTLVWDNYHEFNNYILSFLPDEVQVKSSNEVINIFNDPSHRNNTSKTPVNTLFVIDLWKTNDDQNFIYTTRNTQFYVQVVLNLFEKCLESLSKIPDLEPIILKDLTKKKNMDTPIKSPMKPREKPIEPDPNERPKKYADENKWLWDMFENQKEQFQRGIEPLNEYLKSYDRFLDILRLQSDEYVRELEQREEPVEIEEISERIQKVTKQKEDLKELIPEVIQVSCFEVHTSQLLADLQDKLEELINKLKQSIAKRCRESTSQIFNQFQAIRMKIDEEPKTIEQLTEIREYMNNMPLEIEKLKVDMEKCFEIYDVLEGFNHKFNQEEINKRWHIFSQPREIEEMIEEREKSLEKLKKVQQNNMLEDQKQFQEEVETLQMTIKDFPFNYQVVEEHEQTQKTVEEINQSLAKFQEAARLYNSREALFEAQDMTDYSQITQMQREFQPYSILWNAVHKWKVGFEQWMKDEWNNVDAIECQKFCDDASKSLGGVIRFLRDKGNDAVLQIAEVTKKEIDAFRPQVPLLVALRTRGMNERHWKAISEKVGKQIRWQDPDFNFEKCLELGLLEHIDFCMEQGDKAGKEITIELKLKEMKDKWEEIMFEFKEYEKLKMYIIRGFDDITQILDEDIVSTQAMLFSPYKKPFEEEIFKWDATLKNISDVLEELAKLQQNWMYLQPIFDSKDISKQLPQESKKFMTINSMWLSTIQAATTLKKVVVVCSDEGLCERLKDANTTMDIIQKELNKYLESKKEKFARFYFLSNDELLEILSQTKEPTAVQPHLKKVFENIHRIHFDEYKKIHSMFSGEGEEVKFVKPVDPNKKNVEDWMGELENMMKKSVRNVLLRSVANYVEVPRKEWVLNHPGQCVLNGSQVHWTREVEDAINYVEEEFGIKEYFEKLNEQLNDLVDLVVQPLTKQQQVTLNALIVIDVHARDVIDRLIKERVKDTNAFEWISQLRYEIIQEGRQEDLFCKMVTTVFPYGYEYLGNTLRLVITPLTDKCYMTLMSALKLNYGGAPAGPAGTGKTESTKDLAKALAKQCVVFNCSDQMDYIMVGQFFKGLASAGAWCCFDEFNRINIEVLSVIAQMLRELYDDKAKGEGLDMAQRLPIQFQDSIIKVNPTFSVFITMNPGYAGRTELPDNLKALFRGVAMMVPDYAMIGEIMLYSFGFKQGRELARKMVQCFKLSSEQLSSQSHYDYGMRAVRSVINAAGLLKQDQKNAGMAEDQLLLRALRDVNVPKFLRDDIPLFESIITDLFPTTQRPQYEYGNLESEIDNQCELMKLQSVKPFKDKIKQLYDTIQVRHGLMLVGPTGGGKTSNYKILQQSMSALKKSKNEFFEVQTHILNPKSITLGQLYGEFTLSTHEWIDGIVAYIIRETVKDQSDRKHWVVFDGPVDAVWIESMNTVLDDNKKLCLNSGQILTLTPHMTMMFEVEDLEVASPATVSRCGMVYMEPVSLGLQPLIDSWVDRIPENIKKVESIEQNLRKYFEIYMDKAMKILYKQCKEVIPTMKHNLLQSCTKIINCYLEPYTETEYKKVSKEELQNLENMIEPIFIFAFTWSFLCTVDNEGRDKLNLFFTEMQNEHTQNKMPLEEDRSVYDYFYDVKDMQWKEWRELYKNFEIQGKQQYHELVIPTNDSTRNIYLKKLLLTQNYNVLCPGTTGTGKSQNCYQLLSKDLGEEYQYVALTFSAQTSANQTQDTIDSRFDKRRKGIYGPPIGKKCVIFVDDLNMPKKEEFGAQPPIELLRQFLDHQGWFNRRELFFMKLQDVILLSAMGPPGGGRSQITNRIVRHFNIIAYPELHRNLIKQIFTTMVEFYYRRTEEEIQQIVPKLIESTLDVYYKVRQELLPTPSKSHYTFNMRDIYRVCQGLCSSDTKLVNNKVVLAKLWFHENMRVYNDRLTTDEDRQMFQEMLKPNFQKFDESLNPENVLNIERVIFCDFLNGKDAGNRVYAPVTDLNQYINLLDAYQDDFNNDSLGNSKKNMKLVMFLDACEHIARIARIIRQPQGNALLFGIGGSGRQSLSKLATFLNNYKLFQIEVIKNYKIKPQWKDDCKKVLMMAGVENKPVSFLFVDTQIIDELMLEDINSILNSGDVTGIYQEKDFEDIQNACKHDCIQAGLQPNKMNLFTVYLKRVKKNIHIILAMSPIGAAFQTRLRMFPSLINCCTIDWFTEWPEEALYGVGVGQLIDYEDELKIKGQTETLVNMFKYSHKAVEKFSVQYREELRRYNYVTPTSYLELLNQFKTILQDKNKENEQKIARLQNGLTKLQEANVAVKEMEIVLTDKQPQLKKAQEEGAVMVEILEKEKGEALATKKIIDKEAKETEIETENALKMEKECIDAVAEANANLEETQKEIEKIKKNHLDEIRALQSPPSNVKVILTAVVILMGDYIKSKGGMLKKKVEGAIGGQKEDDFFGTAKAYLLSDTKAFLQILQKDYDKDNINPEYIRKLEKVIKNNPENNADYNLKRAEQGNASVAYMYMWCDAMTTYHEVFTQTQPLRDKLAIVQAEVQEKKKVLKEKMDNLEKINQKIQKLENDYSQQQAIMSKLDQDIQNCKTSLDRAKRLTNSLGDEKERWTNEVANLKAQSVYIPGNSALGAIMLSYSGPFESKYRLDLEKECISQLVELGIQHTEGVNMLNYLGDEVKIQSWTGLYGLPKDQTSLENGIIIECSRRWPLMIDPQNQANKYIKNRGKDEADIETMKISNPKLMREMETAILLGKWVLLENVGTELDPSLEPILLQQVVQVGNSKTIQIGDKTLQYSDSFKLFLTTTLPNPHYSPETSVKVTIINFAITPQGLEEQMLAKIVELEAQQLEDRKNAIVSNNAKDQKLLVTLENDILSSLSGSGGIEELLANENLIQTLDSSKKTSSEIKKRVLDQKKTGELIDREREGYRPVAYRASILFFAILELALVDPMYQYSLQWYIRLFKSAQQNSPQVKDKEIPEQERLTQRLENLNDYFTYSLYENVCRSLFEKDKLLFSFLLAQRILDGKGELNKAEWKYLLAGPQSEVDIPQNKTNWIDQTTWNEILKGIICAAQTLDNFKGFEQSFIEKIEEWKFYYDSTEPQNEKLPGEWEEKFDDLEKIIILKCIRPDKVIPAVQNWVSKQLGPQFIESNPLDLAKCYEDSSIFTPLIFVLSQGSDPIGDFDKFCEAQNMKLRNQKISLGQGQGPKAARLVQAASQNGGWILLQNCHLATSWMSELEKLVEDIDETCHKDFRLWLTSMPSKDFPVSVLQNGIKMTMEPPKGLKANLKRSYFNFSDEELNDSKKPSEFKKLLFGFCLFHAIIQERRKFGPIGWNIFYEFTTEDLIVCKRQLKQLLDDYEVIPYKVLQFLGSVINYGGRVTDDKDGRLIEQIIKVYIDQKVLMEKYKFSESGIYIQPPCENKEEYLNYINDLPNNTSPEAFGMHDNAEITNSQNETRMLLENLQSIEPRTTNKGEQSREEKILQVANNIQEQTPPQWDTQAISEKYPTDYNESMNTVLLQEIIRYNRLLKIMASTLVQVKKALKGMIVMSEELEQIANAMYDNMVPGSWAAKGHKSLKPLASWIIDLKERVEFLNSWINNGIPSVFWFSGFFFPQAFVTGSLQNYARKYKIAIDELQFEFVVRDDLKHEEVEKKPEDGVFVYGMFLEGARWHYNKHMIWDPEPKELYSELPLVHLVPKQNKVLPEEGIYQCPLYKTVDRRGTLSTTGHSTNFVMFFELPSKQKEEVWIRAGVAAFLSLRY